MTLKHLSLLAAAALAFAPLVVAAQQAVDVTAYREAEDDDLIVQPFDLTVDLIEDMDLKDAGGDEIGEVDDVLISRSRSPSRSGASSASGDREVVLGLDQLKLMDDRQGDDRGPARLEGLAAAAGWRGRAHAMVRP